MGARGPLPAAPGKRRRTNAPTIPTRSLPAAGFAGPYPRLPKGVELGEAGRTWWHWAWRTPQAAAWDAGSHVSLALRASLEDDMAALRRAKGLDLTDVLGLVHDAEVDQALRDLEWLVRSLASLIAGRLAIAGKILDLDRQFGLTTKSFHDLRFEIVAAEPAKPVAVASDTPSGPRRLRAVDQGALAGA